MSMDKVKSSSYYNVHINYNVTNIIGRPVTSAYSIDVPYLSYIKKHFSA